MYIITPESNFSFLDVLRLICCCFHQSLIIEQLQGVHFLSVFELLLVFHLSQEDLLMFFVYALQVILLLLLVLEKGTSIFFPYICLFGINFFLLDLFLFFLVHLSSKIISHLCFLFLSYSLTSFLFLLFLSELVFNMSHHFFIFGSDLFFLVFDNRIGK